MIRCLLLAVVAAFLFASPAAYAQQGDFGRFLIGMTVAEARAASPEQQWREQSFGADLVVLTAERSIQLGRLGFTPMLDFRDGRLEVIHFSGGGPISERGQCDNALAETVAALERHIGALNSFRAPAEFGEVVATRATNGGSQIRYYNPSDLIRAGFATQRGERFVQVSSLAGPIPDLDLACMLSIEMQTPLNDFEPLPPPTAEQLAAAQEIDSDWAVVPGPRVNELTMPAASIAHVGRVRVHLDCIVIDEQRVNCAVESEEPAGMHFGDGALAASRFYRIEPFINGQSTVGKRVRLTVRYDLARSAPQ